jgi:hypothetical protein
LALVVVVERQAQQHILLVQTELHLLLACLQPL